MKVQSKYLTKLSVDQRRTTKWSWRITRTYQQPDTTHVEVWFIKQPLMFRGLIPVEIFPFDGLSVTASSDGTPQKYQENGRGPTKYASYFERIVIQDSDLPALQSRLELARTKKNDPSIYDTFRQCRANFLASIGIRNEHQVSG